MRIPAGQPTLRGGTGRVLLVTGMSGAGKTTALKALEDLGFEAVDNLPLSLLRTLARQNAGRDGSVAIGVDIRTRDFGVAPVLAEIEALMDEAAIAVSLLFLDCDDEVLSRRFVETRRPHPLADDRPPTDGIRLERQLMHPLRDRADFVIDTSALTPHELRRVLLGQFGREAGAGMTVFVTSFAYRHGLPREADLVLDVRFLRNPHYDPALREQTGRDAAVGAHIRDDPGFAPFFDHLLQLFELLLPRYDGEGKSYLTIAVGCTGGRHRSVFVAEELGRWLRERGVRSTVVHRDIDRADATRQGDGERL